MRPSSESSSKKLSLMEVMWLLFLVGGIFVGIIIWREASNQEKVVEWKQKYENLLETAEADRNFDCRQGLEVRVLEENFCQNETGQQSRDIKIRSESEDIEFSINGKNARQQTLHKDFNKQEAKSLKLTEYLSALKSAKCSEQDKQTFICSSEHSDKPAIACGKENTEEYKLCSWVNLENLVAEIHKKKLQADKVKRIGEIYADMMAIVKKSWEQLIKMRQNQDLSEEQNKLMKLIDSQEFDKITANDVYEAMKGLSQSKQFLDIQNSPFKIDLMSSSLPYHVPHRELSEEEQFEIDVDYFEHLLEEINVTLNQAKINFQTDRYLLRALRSNKINSKIIMTHKDLWRLEQFFPEGKKPKKYELCYRASENNFDIYKWYDKCGGLTDTVTLVKTTTGQVIGGYTPLSFGTENQTQRRNDESNETFLFSITENDKFMPYSGVNREHIYYVHENYQFQPQFGFNSDLVIKQNSGSNFKSFADIGSKYRNPKYSVGMSESWRKFTGLQKSKNFSTIEWEFHKIITVDDWLIE